MDEPNISISESGNYKVDLSSEINALQNQTIITALYGLIIISLFLSIYFFFNQKPVSHAAKDYSADITVQDTIEEQGPKILQEGSRTLESSMFDSVSDSRSKQETESSGLSESVRTDNVQAALNRTVAIADTEDSNKEANEVVNKEVNKEVEINIQQAKPLTALTENEKRRQRNQIKLFCAKLGEKLGSVSVADCLQYEFIHSGTVSNEKTPITYLDYKPKKADPIKVLLFGGIHGDEFSAVSIVFKWLRYLENEYGQESKQNIHWRIVPVLNPDGLLQPDGKSKRMNANNVDLNRNFPTPDWQDDAHRFWKEKTGENKRRYPGESAASEIETQWVLSQLDSFKPHAVISVHAPFGIVDADGPAEPPQKLGPLELKLLGTYPGSMGRYIGVHKNLPMLTVELERAGSMPKQDDIEHIWLDIQDWISDKVQDRNVDEQAELQSLRREESDDNGSTVIDKKGGD